jgi:sugar lactone lactonase YvrE
LYAVSGGSGNITRYDGASAKVMARGLHGRSILAMPDGGLYVTASGSRPGDPSQIWLLKDGRPEVVDMGLKFATGLAYRPDRWLLAVADGHSKWAYSYEIDTKNGALMNKERYFWFHEPDGEDDAGAEAICYALEGQMFVATRLGIQVCADDGPTQVILPLPDRSRATSVCLGGKDMDTLYAFSEHNIWKRKVKVHAVGAFTPWTKVMPTKL